MQSTKHFLRRGYRGRLLAGLGAWLCFGAIACRVAAPSDATLRAAADGEVKSFDAKYAVTVKGPYNLPLCAGEVTVALNSNFTVTVPNGQISCGPLSMCQVNVAEVLKALDNGSIPAMRGAPDDFDFSDKRVIRLKRLQVNKGGSGTAEYAEFTPPRAVMPSPLALKPEELKDLTLSQDTTVKLGDKSAQGNLTLRVVDVDKPFTHADLKDKVDRALSWELSATGFDGFPRLAAGIVSKIYVVWGIKPFGVPYLTATTKVGDVIQVKDGKGAASLAELAKLCNGADPALAQILGTLGDGLGAAFKDQDASVELVFKEYGTKKP